MRYALVVGASLAFAAPAFADGPVVNQATCHGDWSAPQLKVDGSNLADLKEYGIYVAATPAALAALTVPVATVAAPELDPPSGKQATWLGCQTLAPGQWYAQVDAARTNGVRSARSGVSPFVLQDAALPQAPGAPVFGQ